jgi:predicted permease
MLQRIAGLFDVRSGSGDLRYVLRSLCVDLRYSLPVIAALALGLAFSTAVFAVVDGVLFRPLPYRDADRLFTVDVRMPAGEGRFLRPGFAAADLDVWMTAVPGIGLGALRHAGRMPLGEGINETMFTAAEVDARLFGVLGVGPMLGGFLPEHFAPAPPGAPRPAIVTYDVWRGRFGGDPQAIGRRIITEVDRRLSVEVVGVMPPGFSVPTAFDAQLLLAAPPGRRFENVIARIPDKLGPPILAQRIAALLQVAETLPTFTVEGGKITWKPDVGSATSERPTVTVEGNKITVTPPAAGSGGRASASVEPSNAPRVRVRPLDVALTEGERPVFLAGFCAALALIVVACLSVSGLMASRGQSRTRELAIRRALGADNPAVVRLLLTESVLLAACGMAAGLLLAEGLLAMTLPLLPPHWRLLKAPSLDWRAVSFAGLAAMACSIALSLLPLHRSLWVRMASPLSAGTYETPRVRSFGRVLVAGEVAFGLALTVAGTLTVASLLRIWAGDLGFEADNVVSVDLQVRGPAAGQRQTDIGALIDRVRRLPGVFDAGVTDARILMHNAQKAAFRAPADALPETDVYQHPVTAGVLAVMRPRLVAGRIPTATEFERDGHILVSEGMARAYWPGRDPLGQTIEGEKGGMFTVAGVIADARYLGWDFPPMPFAYVPYAMFARSRTPTLLIRTSGRRAGVIPEMLHQLEASRATIRPVRIKTIDELLNETVSHYRFESWLFASFAGASLALLGVGVLGLISMNVARRTREIGVRMALGATRLRVVRLLLTEQLAGVAAGLAAGSLIAAWAVPALRASLYETTVYDPRVWTVAIAVVFFAAVAGTLLPAFRASRVDPATILRVE